MKRWLLLFIVIYYKQALGNFGLDPISLSAKVQEGSNIQVINMPKVRSQDSIGVCYAFAAATLIDTATCAYKKIENCSEVSDDLRVSPLDLTRYQSATADDPRTDRLEFEGLNINAGVMALSLQAAIKERRTDAFMKESCSPFDQLISKESDPQKASKIEMAMWKRFKKSYEDYKKLGSCTECGMEFATARSKEFLDDYKISVPNEVMLQAFAQDSYEKFLDYMLIPEKCLSPAETVDIPPNLGVTGFPARRDKNVNYDRFVQEIKLQLGRKIPVGITYCAQEPLKAKSAKDCENSGHALVIKGYRRICDAKNKCRDALQVQNSWGEQWQKDNSDGWVDAKVLIDRTFYNPHSLIWVENQSSAKPGDDVSASLSTGH